MPSRNAAFQTHKIRPVGEQAGHCYARNRANLTLLALLGTAGASRGLCPTLAVAMRRHPSEGCEVLWRRVTIAEQGHHRGGRGRRRLGRWRRVLFLHGGVLSIPTILLDHVSQLDDVLALLVLLARLEGVLIFPAKCGFAAFTVDVRHRMEARE